MEAVVQDLAQRLVEKLQHHDADHRYLVGLCGIPGSGKSVLAVAVVNAINKIHRRQDVSAPSSQKVDDIAIVVGMDGWHLTRAQLQAMPDPQLAKDRRGAEWTFDAKGFADFVESLRAPISETADGTLWAPSFSHSVKDPVEHDIPIPPTARLLIIEGLYANLNADGGSPHWARASRSFDERWLIEVDRNLARQRLIIRHVQTGVATDEKEAAWRADQNDLPNGDFLLSHLQEPVLKLGSFTDDTWIKGMQ
ncbi:unnamed protein product [Tilletia controversa]|uniref:Phosphoribulokinase/uridine kinase domain-containing protein n=2 Tax=Tilletia TaxID=13289 RepID=A0A177VH26_9BASI|nr:hypothetical protein CF335_g4131 [Tilletia laevis]KAE8259432.1 hypothetical protein A4X03_0g4098 [Tilletia caries]CAD6905859.1 unnamed protein product [Tilletia controversa]KAE8200794.1 hypothetical protein CF336_g517 [Tilletia laevis]CAD6884843.1 unnamed protein product [Tilletia caries]